MKQNIYDNEEFFDMYKSLRETRVTYNDFIEQPAIKAMLPSLKNLNVLDLGCGFGELAHYMIENGAIHVTGVDISEKMLSIARRHKQIQYIHDTMEDVAFNEHYFDLVVSSLAFHYVEDYEALIHKIVKWLKPGGWLVFSTEHPIVVSSKENKGWIRDSENNVLYWPIDNYGDEGLRSEFWGVDGVVKYHRKLSTLMNVLIEAGLTIQKINEPESTPEGLHQLPKLINEKKRPSFIVIKAKKAVKEDCYIS